MKETQLQKPSTKIELIDLPDDIQEPMTVANYGTRGSGKTRFGATFPAERVNGREGIGLIALDSQARQTFVNVAKKELGKRVLEPNINLMRAPNPMIAATLRPACKLTNEGNVNGRLMAEITREMNITKAQPVCCAVHHYRWHLNRVKHVLSEMVQVVRSVVIDNGTTLWDDILFANHGRTDKINPMDRAPDNREMREIMDLCAQHEVHLCLPHRDGDEWSNNKPTGRREIKGWGQIEFECSVVLHHRLDKGSREWKVDIEKCTPNATLLGVAGKAEATGLVDETISFPALAALVYPDQDPEVWL